MSRRLNGSTLQVSGFLDEFEKDQVKRDVDIVSLFSSFGVSLEKRGDSYMGLCPFHDDTNPSLSVDQERGLFHCFGCGASGDIFDVVMKLRGLDFKEALAYLKNGTALESPPVPQNPPRPLPAPETEPEEETLPNDIKLNTVCEHYHTQLSKFPEAVEYLESRGLLNWELLNRLNIGYAPGNLREIVGDRQYKMLKDSGVFTDKNQEAFTGCITFPLSDESGKVVGLYGRKISSSGRVKHLYLKGPHRGLFNGKAFTAYPEQIILTESVIDALSLMVMGIPNVVPIYGTNGVTSDHADAIKEVRTKEIVLALDNDEAGRMASAELKEKLLTSGVSVREVFPPEPHKDWNDALHEGFCAEQFSSLWQGAIVTQPSQASQSEGASLQVEEREGSYYFSLGNIDYRISGVKEGFISSLKITLRAKKEEQKFIDKTDLYSARSRTSLAMALSRELQEESGRIEKDLMIILEWLEADRDRKLSGIEETVQKHLTAQEEILGMALLTAPDLFDRIEEDLSSLGYVGESVNKILMYLAASSRRMKDPISVIVISQSAAGKSYLIDTVKKLIPADEVISLTSLSDQALNYLPEEALLHKFLVMGEAVHSDIVDHQLREMLSGHELSRLVTSKDEKTGRMMSKLIRKKVIVSAVMSSTSNDINPENASRCFVINTDETENQTRAIHKLQRQKYTLERYRKKETEVPKIIEQHLAAQRLLQDRIIVNPLAEYLDFPATQMRARRDHERFMDLIASVCFLRQFQKEEKTDGEQTFIEVDLTDYSLAYRIMTAVLPATLSNFPKSAQLLFDYVSQLLKDKAERENLSLNEVAVTQREIREETGLSHDIVKRNMRLLCEYEYVQVKRKNYGGSWRYYLPHGDSLNILDLSAIPSPEAMEQLIRGTGAEPGQE